MSSLPLHPPVTSFLCSSVLPPPVLLYSFISLFSLLPSFHAASLLPHTDPFVLSLPVLKLDRLSADADQTEALFFLELILFCV